MMMLIKLALNIMRKKAKLMTNFRFLNPNSMLFSMNNFNNYNNQVF